MQRLYHGVGGRCVYVLSSVVNVIELIFLAIDREKAMLHFGVSNGV